jgi:CheY-like chemotaxis protein
MSRKKSPYVLLVDDDKTTAEILAETFTSAGAEVAIAHDAKEAILSYLNKRPDIVFSDYIMPEIDGVQLMKSLKALEPKLPFVLFSGYHDKLIKELEKETVKPEATLRKPFLRMEKIIELLNDYAPKTSLKPM